MQTFQIEFFFPIFHYLKPWFITAICAVLAQTGLTADKNRLDLV